MSVVCSVVFRSATQLNYSTYFGLVRVREVGILVMTNDNDNDNDDED